MCSAKEVVIPSKVKSYSQLKPSNGRLPKSKRSSGERSPGGNRILALGQLVLWLVCVPAVSTCWAAPETRWLLSSHCRLSIGHPSLLGNCLHIPQTFIPLSSLVEIVQQCFIMEAAISRQTDNAVSYALFPLETRLKITQWWIELGWEACYRRELGQSETTVTAPLLFHMSEHQQQPLRIFLAICSLETEHTDVSSYPELTVVSEN